MMQHDKKKHPQNAHPTLALVYINKVERHSEEPKGAKYHNRGMPNATC